MSSRIKYLVLSAAVILTVSCDKTSLYTINRIEGQPYLGETYVEDYDFEAGNSFLINNFAPSQYGACSAMRHGDYHARNLDWFLMDYALLVVHTPAKDGRYASVGVVSSSSVISKEIIAGGSVPEQTVTETGTVIENFRSILPVFTTDGINEKGVCINVNIVLHEDGAREGYVPCTGHGGTPISFHAIPRYVLDNCASVDEAIGKLSRLSVVQDSEGPLVAEDCHYMISDSEKTAVVEWYNNECVYNVFTRENGFRSANGLPCIMTNFYVDQWEKHTTEGNTDWEELYRSHPFAMGVERARILADGFDDIHTEEQIQKQIEKVLYSKYYDIGSKWYSENPGSYTFKDGLWHIKDSDMTFTDAQSAMMHQYDADMPGFVDEYGSLDKQMKLLESGVQSSRWYTELTVVFDIPNKEINLLPQEGWFAHKYYRFGLK